MLTSPALLAPKVDSSVSRTGISIPELLILRFKGSVCIRGDAGELWQQLFSISGDVTNALPSLLSSDIVKLLLSIAHRMSIGELQFRQFQLCAARQTRRIEAQFTVNANDETVILLRDVTTASLARAHNEQCSSLVALLSPREMDVLCLVVDGATNKAVARKLYISEKTVEKHRASIMRKTGARHVAELVRLTYPILDPGKSA